MVLSRIDRFIRQVPILQKYYLKYYCDIRFNLFKLSRAIPILKYPRYVHLLVTYDCDMTCQQCQVDASTRKVEILTHEQIARVLREMKGVGTRHLILTGGEPLVRKDIFDILRSANEAKIPHITLATNGYTIEKYRNELSKVRIDRVVTSIDDVEEKNDIIRGKKGAFQKSLRALDISKEMGIREREINTTVFPENISRMRDLAEVVAASSATRWIIGLLIPAGRALSLQERTFQNEKYLELFGVIKELRSMVPVELNSHTGYIKNFQEEVTSEPFFCRAGLETCAILPDGEVVPCNITTNNAFSEGNVKEKSFVTIWKEGFASFRNPSFPQICNGCEFLSACRGGCWGYLVLKDRFCFKNFCT